MVRGMAPGYVILAVVQGWSLHAFGGTLGKKLMGLRIVRTDGTRAGFVRLFFGRGAAAMLPNFIPILNMFWWLLDPLLIFATRANACTTRSPTPSWSPAAASMTQPRGLQGR